MAKSVTTSDEEIFFRLLLKFPDKIGIEELSELLDVKMQSQKHWSDRLNDLDRKGMITIDIDEETRKIGRPKRVYFISGKNLENLYLHYSDAFQKLPLPFTLPFQARPQPIPIDQMKKAVSSDYNQKFMEKINHLEDENEGKVRKEMLPFMIFSYLTIAPLIEMNRKEFKRDLGDQLKQPLGVFEKAIKEYPGEYAEFRKLF
ncbi:MAG: hypothetical protein ABIG96_05320 [Candidatus Micrarchaeota archaeon]